MLHVSKRVGRAIHRRLGPSVKDSYSPSGFISDRTALSILEISSLLLLLSKSIAKLFPEPDNSLHPIRWRGVG